jgi:hypothetical protein
MSGMREPFGLLRNGLPNAAGLSFCETKIWTHSGAGLSSSTR